MTPRQARTERRAAERKALKIARKATQHLAPDAPPMPDPAIKPRSDPELEDEFPREFQIHANSIRDRIARQVASGAHGFVSQNTAASPARAEINRANSQHSTGPALPQGNWLRLAIL